MQEKMALCRGFYHHHQIKPFLHFLLLAKLISEKKPKEGKVLLLGRKKSHQSLISKYSGEGHQSILWHFHCILVCCFFRMDCSMDFEYNTQFSFKVLSKIYQISNIVTPYITVKVTIEVDG